ncbi:MAG: protein phosphatase 2C domain-containing protein [Minicystis sp.]
MSLRVVGASVQGPAHARAGERNQDAWYARAGRTGALAVVADGMGSRPAAREGANAAVAACRAAFRDWAPSPTGNGEDLVRLIEVLWRLRLGQTPSRDAATTCLVCALRPDGSGVALQLGDGLLGILDASGVFTAVSPERDGFSTTTLALGVPHGLRDWIIEPLGQFPPGAALLLATDGVADDLVPEKRSGFLRWVVEEIGASVSPSRALGRALRTWPVPRHLDDKTVVAIWEPVR